jgi:hypothetical protein
MVDVVGAIVVLDVVLVLDVVDDELLVVLSATVVDVLLEVDDVDELVLSALLWVSEHALIVNTNARRVRPARARREVISSVCQQAAPKNVQVSG